MHVGAVSLDQDNFESIAAQDDRVWLVEVGSKFCGSCQAFAPTWEKLITSPALQGRVRVGVVVVDDPSGMALATKLNALSQGLPAVLLLARAGAGGKVLMAGEAHKSKKELKLAVLAEIDGLSKDSSGLALKMSGEL